MILTDISMILTYIKYDSICQKYDFDLHYVCIYPTKGMNFSDNGMI